MFTTRLLAAAFAAAMCVPAYADDALTPPAEQSVLPRYNQLPQNYEEFAAIYNKVLAALRDARVQSIHKCFPAGATPSDPHGWCQDKMKLPDRKGGYFSAVDIQRDDGKLISEVCLSDNSAEQRCFRNDGMVFDQALDKKTDIYTTYREVAGAWNERGKPLSDLKPDAPNPPAATPSPPAEPSPPAATSVVPPKFNQIPNSYEEFAAVYNKALAFLRGTGAQSVHKCHPVGADPSNPNHGWCSDQVFWGDPKGQHIIAADLTQDDGKHSVLVCLGDDINTQRCYRDDGAVFDQRNDRKIEIWVTFSTVAAAWNERGKPLSDLPAYRGRPEPASGRRAKPACCRIRRPAEIQSNPEQLRRVRRLLQQSAGVPARRRDWVNSQMFPGGSDPNDHRGWCEDSKWWVNDTGQHLAAVDTQRDDGTKVISLCFGDPNTQRCYEDNGTVFDQSSQPKNQYLGHFAPHRWRLERTRQAPRRPHTAREKQDQAVDEPSRT